MQYPVSPSSRKLQKHKAKVSFVLWPPWCMAHSRCFEGQQILLLIWCPALFWQMGVLTAFPTLQRTFRASLSPEPPNEPRDKCQIDGTTSLGRTHLGENALLSFSFFLSFLGAISAAYGGSRLGGQIGIRAVATSLCHSHSNIRSELHRHLHHSSQQRQILNPLSEARDRTSIFMDTS